MKSTLSLLLSTLYSLVVRDERDRWSDSAESSHGLEGDIQDLGVGINSRYEVFGCS